MAALSPSRLRELVEPVVEGVGYDLEAIDVSQAGRRSVVRVVVDRDGGVDLDAVADVSREVSRALDASDALGERPYVLEVTSPGVDRPLTEPRHWRRNIGRKVTAGDVAGRICGVSDHQVSIETADGAVDIPFADLGPGQIELEFGR